MEKLKNERVSVFYWQLSCLSLVGTLAWLLFSLLAVPPTVQITACDVGQGDAVLIQYGQSFILIDSGPNSSILRCLQAEISVIDPVLDLVVLTHPDKDHIGGWENAAEQYRVANLWTNGQSKNPKDGASNIFVPVVGSLLRAPGLAMSVVWNGELLDLWEGNSPPEEKTNERSVGLYLASQSFGFLSLGDLACQQELAVTSMPLLSEATILKTSHHGSKTSSCEDFLKKIHTETAIVSVGEKNSYNHPEVNVLSTLEKLGAHVYRTDLQGKITFSGGFPGRILIRTERSLNVSE